MVSAMKLAGSETLFWQILREYARSISKKTQLIQKHLEEKNWKRYTIEAHALKSFSRQVGALELSDLAAQMEQAGNNNDINFILAHHEEMLEKYQAYAPILEKYLESPTEAVRLKDPYNGAVVQEMLKSMEEAIDNLDMDIMDEVVKQLDKMELPDNQTQCFLMMEEAVEGLDVETCEKVVAAWKKLL